MRGEVCEDLKSIFISRLLLLDHCSSHELGALLPVGAVDPDDLVPVPLGEVDEAAVHEDRHHDEDEQEAQLFIRLVLT